MNFKKFREAEDGAITVDWVVLTAAIVALGVAVLATVTSGTTSLASNLSQEMENNERLLSATRKRRRRSRTPTRKRRTTPRSEARAQSKKKAPPTSGAFLFVVSCADQSSSGIRLDTLSLASP